MKASKKLSNKLILKKETIANLKNGEMKGIYGGSVSIIPGRPCFTMVYCSAPEDCYPM
jgi:hypothetical protein